MSTHAQLIYHSHGCSRAIHKGRLERHGMGHYITPNHKRRRGLLYSSITCRSDCADAVEGYERDKGDIIQFAVNSFNRKYKPTGTNWVTLFRLTYYKTYVQQGLRYQMQMTLAKTNCTTEEDWLNAICTPVPNTASI